MAEAELEVNGGLVVHDFVGPEDGEVVVITPGGRFSKDYPRVSTVWPTLSPKEASARCCGTAELRSLRHPALRALRVAHAGGDAGADAQAARHRPGHRNRGFRRRPRLDHLHHDVAGKVRKLAVWSIVGGTYSTMSPGERLRHR